MTGLEGWQNPERQNFGPRPEGEAADLSRSTQSFYEPIMQSKNRENLPWALDFGTGADLYQSAAYTGERLSARASMMTDEVEQKTDATKIQRPSDATTEAGVISGQTNQNEHEKAFKIAHAADRTPSGIMPALHESFGIEGDLTAADLGNTIQKPVTEKVLLAQTVPETENGVGSDGRWHFQNPRVKPGQDIAGAIKEWIWNDAQNVPGDIAKGALNVGWNAAVGISEAINRNFGTNTIPEGAAMDYISGIVKNPEKYDQPFRDINPAACNAAYHAFGLDKLSVDPNLIAGLIWNEQLHLKPVVDDLQNTEAALNLPLAPDKSIGPAQIQVKNIQRLAEEYPALKQFGDPIKAALDPKAAPFFVAAYLASEAKAIGDYNLQHPGDKPIPVNTDTLAYRYNSDVYRDQQGNLRSLEPWEKVADRAKLLHGVRKEEFPIAGVLENSHHLRKVRQAMAEVARGEK